MLANAKESTRRALRTALQAVAAFAAFLIAVAIPPIGDAVNSVIDLFPGANIELTPGVVAGIGLFGVALTALVTKIQNLVEGRDQIADPTELAVRVTELSDLVKQLIGAAHNAGVEVGDMLTEYNFAHPTDHPAARKDNPQPGDTPPAV